MVTNRLGVTGGAARLAAMPEGALSSGANVPSAAEKPGTSCPQDRFIRRYRQDAVGGHDEMLGRLLSVALRRLLRSPCGEIRWWDA